MEVCLAQAPPPQKFVCRLHKSLYGLKQSACNWQLLLVACMRDQNFLPLFSDNSVFISRKDSAWCVVGTHVDDLFPLYNKEGKILVENLFKNLSKKIDIKNLGEISWALKTSIIRDRENGTLKISQHTYTKAFHGPSPDRSLSVTGLRGT